MLGGRQRALGRVQVALLEEDRSWRFAWARAAPHQSASARDSNGRAWIVVHRAGSGALINDDLVLWAAPSSSQAGQELPGKAPRLGDGGPQRWNHVCEVTGMPLRRKQLKQETVGGEPYEFYPLGKHIVSAPAVCDGEPTFKYTRIAIPHALDLLAGGRTVQEVAQAYAVPVEAVHETIKLATRALRQQTA